MSKKTIVILGATGTQGSSVVRAFLSSPNVADYRLRAVTRDTTSPSAIALAAKGIEVLPGTQADKTGLLKAFDGAWAVFGVTVPFMHGDGEDEAQQGMNIVDACREKGVRLLVWSSLPSAKVTSGGKYTTVAHLDKKAQVDAYIRGVNQPAVILHTGMFAENLLNFHQLRRSPENQEAWEIFYPVLKGGIRFPGVWTGADLGNVVRAVVDRWEDPLWREKLEREPVVLAPYMISIDEMVETIRKVTGKEVGYVERTEVEEFEKNVYGWINDGFYNYPAQSVLRDLGVETHSFEDYVKAELVPVMQSS